MRYLLILLAAAVIFPLSLTLAFANSDQPDKISALINLPKRDPSPTPVSSPSPSATPNPTPSDTPEPTTPATPNPTPVITPAPIVTPPPVIDSPPPAATPLPESSSGNSDKHNNQKSITVVLGAQTTPPQSPPPAQENVTDPIIPFIQNLLGVKPKNQTSNANRIIPPKLLRYGASPADFYLNQRLNTKENLILLAIGISSLGAGLYLYRPLLLFKLKRKFWSFSPFAPVTAH